MNDYITTWISISVMLLIFGMVFVGFSISEGREAGDAVGREKEFARNSLLLILATVAGALLWPVSVVGLLLWGAYIGLKSLFRLLKDAFRG